MTRPVQPSLFPVRAQPLRVPVQARHEVEPFDFPRDGDVSRCTPRPDWVVPEWLRLPTDPEVTS